MTTIPSGSMYENILDAYLGSNYANETKGFLTEKDVLWNAFLAQNNLSPTDPKVVNQDPAVLEEFVNFVRQTYSGLQTGSLSPGEVNQRGLLFSVYDLMVLMMETLQNNAGVIGKNVAFLANYQDQYAQLQGTESSGFYIGGSLSTPSPDTSNLAKWTLGYGGVNMQQYLQTAINGIAQTPAGGGPLQTTYFPLPSSSPVSNSTSSPLTLSSVNLAYPATTPGMLEQGQALLTDALSHVGGLTLGGVTLPIGGTDYSSQAMNTLQFSSTASSVTFTYTYQQQYDYSYTQTTSDAQGNVSTNTQGPFTGFYPVTVQHTVNYNPDETYQDKLTTVTTAFQTFMNTSFQPTGFPPADPTTNAPYPAGSELAFAPSEISGAGPDLNYTNVTSHLPSAPQQTIYNSMTQPQNFYFSNNEPSVITAIRAITIPWNSSKNYDPNNPEDSDNTSFNIPYTSTTDETASALQSTASSNRANQNSLLQQFLSNAQAKQQILSNTSDAQTSIENEAQTGITQAAGVLTTAISQLSTIISALYQKR